MNQNRGSLALHIFDMTAEQRAALAAEVQHWAGDAYEQGQRGADLQSCVMDALEGYTYADPAGPDGDLIVEAGGPLDHALAVAIAREIESHGGVTPVAVEEGIVAWHVEAATFDMPLSATMDAGELMDVARRAGSAERDDVEKIARLVDQAEAGLSAQRIEREADNPTYTITADAKAAIEAVAARLPDQDAPDHDDTDRAESHHAMTGEDVREAFRKDTATAPAKATAPTIRPRPRPRGFGLDM